MGTRYNIIDAKLLYLKTPIQCSYISYEYRCEQYIDFTELQYLDYMYIKDRCEDHIENYPKVSICENCDSTYIKIKSEQYHRCN